MRALRNTERVLNNKSVTRLKQIEQERGGSLTIDHIHELVAGVYPRVMRDGDMDAGAWSCGMVVGLIHDIPTVADLLDDMMQEAASLILNRLARILESPA
jgi:nitronate monooxygenase